jgi:hypothetical protein
MIRPRLQLATSTLAATSIAIALGTHAPHLGAPSSVGGQALAMGAAWAVALSTAAWIGVTSLFALIAVIGRSGVAFSLTRAYAPRFVRHLVEASVVATLLVAPARAAVAGPAPTVPVALPGDQPVVRAPAPPAPAPVAKPKPVPIPPAIPARTHVVVPGDNLWRIARDELLGRGHTQPDTATIARYWWIVIERNRGTLRSHDPNLIYPGETIALPDPS